ncbi:MAG TPA: response regulator transcription factor [Terriglobales bacterium]|nr:response regulator transcription factor [Terriglobales bacterium]
MNENILIVEDEEALRMVVSDRLRREGFVVDSAPDGTLGFDKATSLPFDLIILDIMLPGRNGLDLCRDVRVAGLNTPILLLTARSEIADKVVGLKLGADDYLTKPFDMTELMARVEALLRRVPCRARKEVYELGSVRIDVDAMEVTREGVPVPLGPKEFQLLCYFVEHRGDPRSRNEILREVWGRGAVTLTRTVDVHVVSLRQKLEQDPKRPELILTVPGVGYKLAG